MRMRFEDFKSKIRHLVGYCLPRKGMLKFPEEIDYNEVLKNHEVLMNAYGAVLKRDSKTVDAFFRSVFIESHIYKNYNCSKRSI